MFELYRSSLESDSWLGYHVAGEACQGREYRLWRRHKSPGSFSEGTSCATEVKTMSPPSGLQADGAGILKAGELASSLIGHDSLEEAEIREVTDAPDVVKAI
jgi:hypothetical protein